MRKKHLWVIAFFSMGFFQMGCSRCQNSSVAHMVAADSQKVDETDVQIKPVEKDSFESIERVVYWKTTQKDSDWDDYLYSENLVNVQWPVQLVGCRKIDALQKALLERMFVKVGSSDLEQALKVFLDVPAFLEIDSDVKYERIKKEQLPSEAQMWQTARQMKVQMTSPEMLVFQVDSYEYSGGAHGMYGVTYLLYSRKLDKVLEAKDVFVNPESPTLLAKINKVVDGMRKQTGVVYEKAKAISTFYLTPDKLVMVYQPYEIGPYALGVVSVEISYTIIEDEFTAEFKEILNHSKEFKVLQQD